MALKNKFALGMLMYVICFCMLFTTHQVAEAVAVSSPVLNGHLQVTGVGDDVYDVADLERTSLRRELREMSKSINWTMILRTVDQLCNSYNIYIILNNVTGKYEKWNSAKVKSYIDEPSRVQYYNIFLLVPLPSPRPTIAMSPSPSPLPSPSSRRELWWIPKPTWIPKGLIPKGTIPKGIIPKGTIPKGKSTEESWKTIKDTVDKISDLYDIYDNWKKKNSVTGTLEEWKSTEVKNYIDEHSQAQYNVCDYNMFLLLPLQSLSPSSLPSSPPSPLSSFSPQSQLRSSAYFSFLKFQSSSFRFLVLIPIIYVL